MQSADHYDQEVSCLMTELARQLQTASDAVMTVAFRKKLNEEMLRKQLDFIYSPGSLAERVFYVQ